MLGDCTREKRVHILIDNREFPPLILDSSDFWGGIPQLLSLDINLKQFVHQRLPHARISQILVAIYEAW